MASLAEVLARIEGRLASLLAEVQELREQVWALQEENHDLRALLYRLGYQPSSGRGLAALRQLYQEGYHVCPPYFARPLTEGMGCLFCLALLAGAAGGRENGERA